MLLRSMSPNISGSIKFDEKIRTSTLAVDFSNMKLDHFFSVGHQFLGNCFWERA